MGWVFVTSCTDRETAVIGGVDIRSCNWVQVPGEIAHVIDPIYRQSFRFRVFDLTADGKTVRIACGEFSNGISGFYLPENAQPSAQADGPASGGSAA